jgi:hypothetical protein
MAARVKDRVVTVAAIARTVEATVATAATITVVMAAVTAMLPARATWARAASPVLLHLPSRASTTPPYVPAGSCRCAWSNQGRPSIHTSLGADLDSTADVRHPAAACHISILDALA